MTIGVGQLAPDFEQDTANGSIRFYEWLGSSWCALFSHPQTATPLCTAQIAGMARLRPAWKRRQVRVIGLSTGTAERHIRWAADVEATHGCTVDFPLIADCDRAVATLYGLHDPACGHGVFVLDPRRVVRVVLNYPPFQGCNFTEILRAIDRVQSADGFAARAAEGIAVS